MDNFLGKSHRLQNWNYGWNGFYYITICTKNRQHYFGKIENGEMILNSIGMVANRFWREIPEHFNNVKLDEFVVMPNHIHAILIIDNDVGTRQCLVSEDRYMDTIGQQRWQNQGRETISSIVGSFKSICTKTINRMQDEIFFVWQPRFYDHIIRNKTSLNSIREYIRDNPLKWDLDEYNR